jgi:hypothetical protein
MIATTKTRTWREGGGVWGFDGESEAMERERKALERKEMMVRASM